MLRNSALALAAAIMVLTGIAGILLPGHLHRPSSSTPAGTDRLVFAFYYVWYGSPPRSATYVHWDGPYSTDPSHDLATTYSPALGAYDSADPAVVKQHMAWMKQAGIDVVTISWWGRGSSEDGRVPLVMSAAQAAGLRVNFMIEPYSGETPATVLDDIAYIDQRYSGYPAYLRVVRPTKYSPSGRSRDVIFIYAPAFPSEWPAVVDRLHAQTNDPLILERLDDAALLDPTLARQLVDAGHIDGVFNYGVYSDAWAYAKPLAAVAADYVAMFAASPGYDDSRKPGVTHPFAVSRDNGSFYDHSWAPLANHKPEWVSIVSFNEWTESTQIEPAVPGGVFGYTYNSYEGAYSGTGSAATAYLDRTAYWAAIYHGGL